MSSPTTQQSTFLRLTPDVPVVQERRPSAGSFLSLAPDTSPSYPQMPIVTRQPEGIEPAEVTRRKSSVGNSPKILKLGPVHWGEHLDEHKDDFHDVV